MKYHYVICLFILALLENISAQPARRGVEAGRVIVKLNPDAIPAFETGLRKLNTAPSDTAVLRTGIRSFDRINRRFGASYMRRVFPDAGKYEAKHRRYGLHLWYEITIPEGEDPEKVVAEYGIDGNVQFAEPRYVIRGLFMPAPSLPLAETAGDPDFDKQWNYYNTGQTGGTPGADIRLTDARERIKSSGIKNSSVIVAVTDGGVYHDHEDLKANMWENGAELNGIRNRDDDGNGYTDDIYGYNFVNRTGTISPEDHATHVAGTIAAVSGNGIGVSGIAGNPDDGYGIKIMTIQIINGNRSVSSIGQAFTYAADNGAVISQNSWGYVEPNVYNKSDVEAINYFVNEAGRDENGNPRPGTPMTGGLVIFAAGNDAKDDKWYPACFDNVLAVAATNHYGKLAWYSNYGSWVDISAPGGDTDERGKNGAGGIYSTSYRTNNRNYYEYMQGTSMACPHVSGVAALILSVYGSECYTPELLRSRLLRSATPLATFDPANASKMGAGLLNASEALNFNTDNAAPVVKNHLPDITMRDVANETSFFIGNVFADDDSDKLTYKIYVASENIASAKVINDSMFIKPLTAGKTTLTLTADDGNTGYSYYSLSLTVTKNQAPAFSGLFTDTVLIPRSQPVVVNLAEYASDSENDPLNFIVQIDNHTLVNAAINSSVLTINPLYHGDATLQITASDLSEKATATIRVVVEQKYAPQKDGQLLVYPNPTTDVLWYSFILDEAASVSVRIINAIGQVVYQTDDENHSSGAHYGNINIQGWGTGMYVMQYFMDGKIVDTRKVVKQR